MLRHKRMATCYPSSRHIIAHTSEISAPFASPRSSTPFLALCCLFPRCISAILSRQHSQRLIQDLPRPYCLLKVNQKPRPNDCVFWTQATLLTEMAVMEAWETLHTSGRNFEKRQLCFLLTQQAPPCKPATLTARSVARAIYKIHQVFIPDNKKPEAQTETERPLGKRVSSTCICKHLQRLVRRLLLTRPDPSLSDSS